MNYKLCAIQVKYAIELFIDVHEWSANSLEPYLEGRGERNIFFT